ncbi:MAG: hypothetical protein LBI65_01185 [Candidatus Symbiothrix sp.]|jgi:hypothetical protein|nr:hypothetical protein [Candidatus Symbiothrix sp.]
MDVYRAISEMRKLSQRGLSFSFAFMSFSMTSRKSEGYVEVRRARLRKQSTTEQNRFAGIMLNYFDLDANDYGRCYQPLLMEFNGQKLELN